MINVDLLNMKLKKGLLPPRMLLCKAKLLNLYENCSEYNDPQYYPFYYHLGSQIFPQRVLQIGPQAGLIAHCFLQSCHSVQQWNYVSDSFCSVVEGNTAMYLHKDYSLVRRLPELGKHDLFDLIIISQPYAESEYLDQLNMLWQHLNPQGLLVADYIKDISLTQFCEEREVKPVIFDTRYKIAIFER